MYPFDSGRLTIALSTIGTYVASGRMEGGNVSSFDVTRWTTDLRGLRKSGLYHNDGLSIITCVTLAIVKSYDGMTFIIWQAVGSPQVACFSPKWTELMTLHDLWQLNYPMVANELQDGDSYTVYIIRLPMIFSVKVQANPGGCGIFFSK